MAEESEIPWDKSKARQILWQDLVKGKVPLYANDNPEMRVFSIQLPKVYISFGSSVGVNPETEKQKWRVCGTIDPFG